MNETIIEEKQIITLDNKEYTVITKVTKEALNKEKLLKLICNYAMRELNEEL